ncbi:hypothetical protein FH972_001645 [Carpinus fangiana]|uniref:Serine/threonine-protein phosphatase 2A activator 1 n=1 Tax=Carpinus fangiana TaxID=176857 RepID=A0A5N6QE69_9ROSI|nr:hypothetical protein FH972_001645 [Carpinus fangiana]
MALQDGQRGVGAEARSRVGSRELRAVDLDNVEKNGSLDAVHRFRCERSVLALVVSDDKIFAGTQGGDLLVFDLQTFERIKDVKAHQASILGLCLSRNAQLLFACSGDRLLSVWDAKTLTHLASIYSLYDVGDIFCVSYSSRSKRVYLGAQNTSIQWCNITDLKSRRPVNPHSLPSYRQDRFFDSPGPFGIRTPRPPNSDLRTLDTSEDKYIEIDDNHIFQFAHYGYVYCTLLVQGNTLAQPADEEYLISGGGDGIVNIWALDSSNDGAIRKRASLDDGSEEGNSVLCMAIEGSFLYAGRSGGQVFIWDLETRQLLRRLKPHEDEVLSLSVGRGLLLAASVDGHVVKFNNRYEVLNKWQAHKGRILSSAFATVGGQNFFITGSNDDTIALWNINDCIPGHADESLASQEELVETLRQFVSFRTVSSDPNYRLDCRRGASFLRGLFKQFGASTSMLTVDAAYNPVVFARFRGKRSGSSRGKNVLFYGHYDVVPAHDKQKTWINDPFHLAGIDGYLYGRGASDNKGPIAAAIYAAAELSNSNALEGDVIFLIEGEEESGSRGFKETVTKHKGMVGHVDWILLANSYWLDDEVPCLTYGLRGVINATVEVASNEPDLHSGVDGSRLLDEPLKDLTSLVASLTGPRGRVEIPGFYDSGLPVSKAELRLYHDIVRTLLERNPDLGTPDSLKQSLMARWRDPSLTVHSFKTSGSEKSTIIPRQAQAAISMRLVPNQDVDNIGTTLIQYLEAQFKALGSKNRLSVSINHKAEPWLGDTNNAIFKSLERAVTAVWSGHEPHPRSNSITAVQTAAKSRHPAAPATSSTLASATSPTSPRVTAAPTQPLTRADVQPLSPPKTSRPRSKDGSQLTSAVTSAISDLSIEPGAPRKPLYIREGGSIPAIRFLEKEFDAPAAHLPCGQASDNAHLDNERLRVVNLLNARTIFRRVFGDLTVPDDVGRRYGTARWLLSQDSASVSSANEILAEALESRQTCQMPGELGPQKDAMRQRVQEEGPQKTAATISKDATPHIPRLIPVDPTAKHDFSEPTKKINEGEDIPTFLSSKAYGDILAWILQLNGAMFPRKQPVGGGAQAWEIGSPNIIVSPAVQKIASLLNQFSLAIEEAPPDTGPRRFGNVSFRKWYALVEERVDAQLRELQDVDKSALLDDDARKELRAYLMGGFGSAQRLDYGTGHELSFLAFLGALWKVGYFGYKTDGSEERSIVLGAIEPYLALVRRLILTYNLEPAGTHGVWGLDDHAFVPYIFGSAQLAPAITDTANIPQEGSLAGAPEPGDISKSNVVERERKTNMYFGAIGFINDVKKGPFWEHSPMLFDISGVNKGWAKINKGMIKMYIAEVLSKFPVMQHFPFGSLFQWEHDPAAVPPTASTHVQAQPPRQPHGGAAAQADPTAAGTPSTMAPWAKPSAGNRDKGETPPSTTTQPRGRYATTLPQRGPTTGTTSAPWANPGQQPPGTVVTDAAGGDKVPVTKAPWAK